MNHTEIQRIAIKENEAEKSIEDFLKDSWRCSKKD